MTQKIFALLAGVFILFACATDIWARATAQITGADNGLVTNFNSGNFGQITSAGNVVAGFSPR